MSGGRERDSGDHDRTINETSSEEDEDIAHNPLGVISEGSEGNAEAINPIQVAGNPNPNPNPDYSDDDDMANNTVKPGQLTALRTFAGERGEGFTNWLECLENANDTYQWPPNSLIQVVKAKGGPRVTKWDRGNRLRGRNPPAWAGDAGYRAALILRFGQKNTSATAVNAVADLKQRHCESCAAFLDRVILALDKQHFNLTPVQKQEDGYILVYDAAIMSHFGAGLKDDISKVILGAANPPESVADMLTAAEAVEAETSKMGPPGASALAVAPLDSSDGTYEETLSGLDAKVEELMAAISRFRSRPFDKTKIRCYNCNK